MPSFKQVSEFAEHNDSIILVIVPAAQAPEIASSRALRIAKEYDSEGEGLDASNLVY